MAYGDMVAEISGSVPKIPRDYCYTLVNRAWLDICRKNLWSFLLFESNWFSPATISGGTVSVTQGSIHVVFDATASALINAVGTVPSAITARQFRVGVNTIYNIWVKTSALGIVTLTLDRPYAEASAVGSAYSIFQSYYPAPFQDFKTWLSVRDPINNWKLNTTRNHDWLDERDAQRQNFRQPTHVVPFELDKNPASSTFGWMLFELWGQPQFQLPYILYGTRKGMPLVQDTDTLPNAIGEDCIVALAKSYAYEWADANKGDLSRMAGSDFRFLMGKAESDYARLYKEYRREDRELCDNWLATRQCDYSSGMDQGYYNAIAGVASPGLE